LKNKLFVFLLLLLLVFFFFFFKNMKGKIIILRLMVEQTNPNKE